MAEINPKQIIIYSLRLFQLWMVRRKRNRRGLSASSLDLQNVFAKPNGYVKRYVIAWI
jgi:hypothetical protein